MFESTIALLDKYYWKCDLEEAPGFDAQLVKEIRGRLRQLEHLYDQILTLQNEILAEEERKQGPRPPDTNWVLVFTNFGPPPDPNIAEDGIDPLSVSEQLMLVTEAFYYIAHRVKKIVDQCGASLPQLARFTAAGVARVRNNLLEHANRSAGTSVFSFSVSNAAGVRLRPVSRLTDSDTHMDQGILRNAAEFKADLEAVLERAAYQLDALKE